MKLFHRFSIICIIAFFLVYSLVLPSMSLTTHASEPDYVFLFCNEHSMKVGDEFYLQNITLSGRQPKFKSSKSSIASVSKYGIITAKRPGIVTITAKVADFESYCKITIVPTDIMVSVDSISLYRTEQCKINYSTSTNHKPIFTSSRSSIATVTDDGLVIAKKHGQANIRIKCDGSTVTIPVTVKKPSITISPETITLKVGESYQFKATVSSKLSPNWSVSNINKLSITSSGLVTARQKGKAYVYASEDGTKVSCIVKIIEP